MTANNCKLILHRFFSSLQVICVNSVTKYVGLQKCMRLMSMPKTFLLLVSFKAKKTLYSTAQSAGAVGYINCTSAEGLKKKKPSTRLPVGRGW